MKHSPLLKALALILAVLSLTAAIGSALGIWALADAGLYESDYETQYKAAEENACRDSAYLIVKRFASLTLGGCPEELIDIHYGGLYYPGLRSDKVTYTIQYQGETVVETPEGANLQAPAHYAVSIPDCSYLRLLSDEELQTNPEAFMVYYGKESVQGDNSLETVAAVCCHETAPEYTVHLYLEEGALREENEWVLWKALDAWKPYLPCILAGSGLLFILCAVWLCLAAGRKKGREGIVPGGLNKLPLDLYLLIVIFAVSFFMPYGITGLYTSLRYYPLWVISLVLAMLLGCSVLFVAFSFALVAQLKSPDGYFYKNSFIYRCLNLMLRSVRRLIRAARALLDMLPVIWQWLLTAGILGLSLLLTGRMSIRSSYLRFDQFFVFLFLLTVFACIAVICYGGWCFGVLIKGAKAMAAGDLNKKISTKYLFGSFKVCAEDMNRLADAASIAAQNQMRSERMKAELITNVSHDIKTPLTSIINFVDLLQKPHTEAERQEYLEVLSRQSAQMKRLIEDLIDLSKAATGNMTVSLAPLDAVEAVKQALGEFGDKLDAAELTPIFRHPENAVSVNADGRLLWRTLNNLLGNIVKYALPGTRVYLELTETETEAILSLKNISREELNLTADALMERFVQGDASRSTEGSGLGLNIAQSLMQVQRGSLSLHLDGDLFKVTLTLPKALSR